MSRLSQALLLGLLVPTLAGAQVIGQIGVNDSRLQGADAEGNPLIYSPNPVELGSSISHFDTSASPNLLMEPSINSDLVAFEVDLTDEQMRDIGWTLQSDPSAMSKAANFVIFPQDTGFNDASAFPGAPGNPATTLGQARRNLFNAVLAQWGALINSDVDIDVLVNWRSLPCSNQGAALASAGPIFLFFNNSGALPEVGTWYHSALAEAITGVNQGDPTIGDADIRVNMNIDIDSGCLGAGSSFYYGLDGNPPANQIDAATVLMHELAHGLGFSTVTASDSGAFFNDLPSIYDHFLYDSALDKTWVQMTQAERRVSASTPGGLGWNGPAVRAEAPNVLNAGAPELLISGAGNLNGSYTVGTANFGGSLDTPLTGQLQCYEDAQPEIFDACSDAVNGDELVGRIALIDRGGCPFTVKAANAQEAGAIAAVIINTAGDSVIQMNGTDDSITIPVVSLGQSVGNAIRQAACTDTPADTILLRSGRFAVSARWDDGTTQAAAVPERLTDETAYFYFFSRDNVEIVVKLLEGCSINGNFWVFASGLTDVGVELTVTDTQTGENQVYNNTLGQDFDLIKDLEAFSCN